MIQSRNPIADRAAEPAEVHRTCQVSVASACVVKEHLGAEFSLSQSWGAGDAPASPGRTASATGAGPQPRPAAGPIASAGRARGCRLTVTSSVLRNTAGHCVLKPPAVADGPLTLPAASDASSIAASWRSTRSCASPARSLSSERPEPVAPSFSAAEAPEPLAASTRPRPCVRRPGVDPHPGARALCSTERRWCRLPESPRLLHVAALPSSTKHPRLPTRRDPTSPACRPPASPLQLVILSFYLVLLPLVYDIRTFAGAPEFLPEEPPLCMRPTLLKSACSPKRLGAAWVCFFPDARSRAAWAAASLPQRGSPPRLCPAATTPPGAFHSAMGVWLSANVLFNYYMCIRTPPGRPPCGLDAMEEGNLGSLRARPSPPRALPTRVPLLCSLARRDTAPTAPPLAPTRVAETQRGRGGARSAAGPSRGWCALLFSRAAASGGGGAISLFSLPAPSLHLRVFAPAALRPLLARRTTAACATSAS